MHPIAGNFDWIARDAARLLHPMHDRRSQADAIVWKAGHGTRLIDVHGREYFDGLSGLWNVQVGHGRRELAEAAARQMSQLSFASLFAGSTHERAIELAERLATICYPNITRFFFTTSGSEAIEAAIKTARYYWRARGRANKSKIVCLNHAYHGTTLGAMSATGQAAYCDVFEPRAPGFVHIPAPCELPHDDGHIARQLETAIQREGADRVAALLAEPIQAVGGCHVPAADYWPRVREICDRHDILLIADEVVTGFGRTGRWFALQHWGVQPDMLVMAKGLTSGYVPLGALGVTETIAKQLDRGEGATRWSHAATNSGHPVACAVALANLDIIEREGLVGRAAEHGRQLHEALNELSRVASVASVRGLGLLAAIDLSPASEQPAEALRQAEFAMRVHQAALARGLFSRVRGRTYHLAPPLISTADDIACIVEIVARSIDVAARWPSADSATKEATAFAPST